MSNTVKGTFKFLWPYIIGLLMVRLGIDLIVKLVLPINVTNAWLGQAISLLPELIFIFLAMNNYKKFKNDGELMFSEGVKIGLGLILFFGIIFSAYLVLHGKYIDPSYQESIARQYAIQAKQTYVQGKDQSVFIGFSSSLLRYIFIGAFGSIICSAILKTER